MSALFTNRHYLKIDLNREYGYSTRKFYSKPRVVQASDYDAVLFLCWRQTMRNNKVLPQRLLSYRNHFSLYWNNSISRICLIRTETTVLAHDNDAILLYDWIGLQQQQEQPENSLGATVLPRWLVAYEKAIDYSSVQSSNDNTEATNLFNSNWRLVAWGEWWYFDKGLILCGHSILDYEPDENFLEQRADPTIMFVEFFPKFKSDAAADGTTTVTNNQLNPRVALPLVDRGGESLIIQNNDKTKEPRVAFQSIMPSLYWFQTRDTELLQGDISYFIDDWKETQSYKATC